MHVDTLHADFIGLYSRQGIWTRECDKFSHTSAHYKGEGEGGRKSVRSLPSSTFGEKRGRCAGEGPRIPKSHTLRHSVLEMQTTDSNYISQSLTANRNPLVYRRASRDQLASQRPRLGSRSRMSRCGLWSMRYGLAPSACCGCSSNLSETVGAARETLEYMKRHHGFSIPLLTE